MEQLLGFKARGEKMKVSECCTAQAWHLEITGSSGICSKCKDHATFVDELACETCGNGIPEGEIIKVNLNWGKNIIKSLTRGGIAKLRECGWDIEKKRMINNKD